MKRSKLLIFIQLIFITNYTYSQESNSSIIIETAVFKTEAHYQEYYATNKIIDTYENRNTYGIIISYSTRINLISDYKLELRPSLLLGDYDVMGVDVGLYLRSSLYWKIFGLVGLNAHYNFGNSDNHNTWRRKSLEGIYLFYGGSLGLKLSERISLQIGYYFTAKNNWRNSWSSDLMRSIHSETDEKLFWVTKVGVEINI
ncbi:MAG: hypothetical protein KF721_09815 [Ignavibacteriaceae bacterium]|nr:hypothetical protein [Ignavibacteriaceae bacterium]